MSSNPPFSTPVHVARKEAEEKEKRRVAEKRAMPVWQLRAIRYGALRTCINCDAWQAATEGCAHAQGQRPPANVIVLGCDEWGEEIPF